MLLATLTLLETGRTELLLDSTATKDEDTDGSTLTDDVTATSTDVDDGAIVDSRDDDDWVLSSTLVLALVSKLLSELVGPTVVSTTLVDAAIGELLDTWLLNTTDDDDVACSMKLLLVPMLLATLTLLETGRTELLLDSTATKDEDTDGSTLTDDVTATSTDVDDGAIVDSRDDDDWVLSSTLVLALVSKTTL